MKALRIAVFVAVVLALTVPALGADSPYPPRERPRPTGCVQAPVFDIASFGPQEMKARNNSTVDIAVNGRVLLAAGCGLLGATYSIEDEYGELGGDGAVTVAPDGTFELSVPVEASRKGGDDNGRVYTIVLKARDQVGEGSTSLVVRVMHDQRK